MKHKKKKLIYNCDFINYGKASFDDSGEYLLLDDSKDKGHIVILDIKKRNK